MCKYLKGYDFIVSHTCTGYKNYINEIISLRTRIGKLKTFCEQPPTTKANRVLEQNTDCFANNWRMEYSVFQPLSLPFYTTC